MSVGTQVIIVAPKEKVRLATEMEGHPDNVAPAILGDFVVASHVENQVYHVKHHFPMCDVIAFIPEEPLFTEKSRAVLPEKLAYKEAVAASSIANVMIAAILNGDLPLAGKMMEQDKWHETYMAASEALRVGCKILAITGFSPNALQQQATHCLYTIAEEQATRSAAISSTSAQMMLTDLLFMGLVQQDLERAPERIRHSEALVKKLV